MTRQWTEEEIQQIYKYGKCLVCGEPRYAAHRHERTSEGTIHSMVLTCRNGHDVQ